MRLKDDAVELKHIKENMYIEEYNLLRTKIQFAYDSYIEQKKGLEFRKQRLKTERDDAIKITVGMAIGTIVLKILSIVHFLLYLPCFFLSMASLLILPFYAGRAFSKAYTYSLMMGKNPIIDLIKKKDTVTYLDEEIFLNNKLEEYKGELENNYSEDELNEEIIFRLNKMILQKPYYADAQKIDLKLWPIYLYMVVWVIFILLIFLGFKGYF